MATTTNLSPDKTTLIGDLVQHYVDNRTLYLRFLNALHAQMEVAIGPENAGPLSSLVHSVKYRLKDPQHFRAKLVRKMIACEQTQTAFLYTKENLFETIGDLAGYRILHLHTRQFEEIHAYLVPLLEEAHRITEGPVARTWDEETKAYYKSIGIATEDNERMYSSVHYLVRPSIKTTLTIEIQVRTLADEIWGEIDHKINYPVAHRSVGCREQIRALARVTSSCSRLVDAIMTTHEDWERSQSATGPLPTNAIVEGIEGTN